MITPSTPAPLAENTGSGGAGRAQIQIASAAGSAAAASHQPRRRAGATRPRDSRSPTCAAAGESCHDSPSARASDTRAAQTAQSSRWRCQRRPDSPGAPPASSNSTASGGR
jgi:hypothetical protein